MRRPDRKPLRLKGYDYAQAGAYFVTVCTKDRDCLFGEIAAGVMRLNHFGDVVQQCWDGLVNHYSGVALDAFVVMPNHVHGIIVLTESVWAGLKPAPAGRHPLSEIVRAFKTFSARGINQVRDTSGVQVWQRNFYEHVIRDDAQLSRVRQYIVNNPVQWELDVENPRVVKP